MEPDLARLHRRYAAERDPRDLERLVLRYRGLACALAHRYARPGLGDEDLEQVAYVGLVKALRRFEPDRDFAFSTYAVPTILGELRHFCRQTLWPVHVPRVVQERVLAVRRATADAMATSGRPPTVGALAERLGCEDEAVLDALHAGASFVARSIDGHDSGDGAAPAAEAWLAVEDPGFAAVDDRAMLEAGINRLTGAERALLRLRYGEDLSHRQIGARLGISASHVGRLLAATIDRLGSEDGERTRPAVAGSRRRSPLRQAA